MSQLKLTADGGGGTVAIKGPASTTGNAAIELTVPGTSNATLLTSATSTGKILQVVVNEKTDTASVAGQNNGSSFGDVPNILVTITPTAASSKILVQFCLGKVAHSSNSTGVRFTRSVAGGTAAAIKVGDTASNRKSVSSNILGANLINTGHAQAFNYQFVDTPSYSVGQAIVYQMQVLTEGSNSFFVNRTHDDTDNGNIYFARAFSTITAMEIAA